MLISENLGFLERYQLIAHADSVGAVTTGVN